MPDSRTRTAPATLVAMISVLLALAPCQQALAAGSGRITLTVSSTQPLLGALVTFRGQVSPAAPGRKVRLQLRRADGTWATLRTLTLGPRSRYSTRLRMTRLGTAGYRVVKPVTVGHPRRVTPVVRITVYRWRPLASLARGNTVGTAVPVASANLNGTLFTPAIDQTASPSFGYEGFVEYRTDKRCTRLDTWVGAAPADPGVPPRSAQVWVIGYAGTAPTSSTEPRAGVSPQAPSSTAPVRITLGPAELSAADRVLLQMVQSNASSFTVSWGAPRVLCSF